MKTTIAMCLLAALAARAGSVISSASTPAGQTPAGQAAPSAPQAGYAGSDTCVVCHSDKADTLKGTPHA